MAVNVVAPYVLTARMDRPARLIYLSSGLHRGGRAVAAVDRGSYADSKLLITTFTMALARRWPDVIAHAVDPGWVPTKMGGLGAPDDLALGHRTQTWLATTGDPEALRSGGYWQHQSWREPYPAVFDHAFQDDLLDALARHTGVLLP